MNTSHGPDPSLVSIAEAQNRASYPALPPFHPSSNYPEFSGRIPLSSETNMVYDLLRNIFLDLGLDSKNFLTPAWNPLGSLIAPGNKVLIKPNLVRHIHLSGGPYEAVVTHGSVIRCVLDYVALALNGKGEIVLGDAPVQSADFDEIIRRNSLKDICDDVANIWGIHVKLIDFRLSVIKLDEKHRVIENQKQPGDLSGYKSVDLGKHSLLTPLASQSDRFRVTSYDCSEMPTHHNDTVNEYLIPKAVLDADVIINLPKLKTHRKAGLTASLKNLVGINGHKDWLPHHRCGSIDEGGDEYLNKSIFKKIVARFDNNLDYSTALAEGINNLMARIARRLSIICSTDPYEEGSWYGNNTLWRTVLDLNRLLLYANNDGKMEETPQRCCITIVDAIVAGEAEGPMEPDARYCGLMIGGFNQVAIDTVLSTMVGFDYRKLPLIANAYGISHWPLTFFTPEEIKISTSSNKWQNIKVGIQCNLLNFVPPSGWKGHIEF